MSPFIEENSKILDIVKILKQYSFFSSLDENKLSFIAKHLERKTFPSHTYIIRQNERGDVCYVLLKGTVEVILHEKSIATLGPGSLFGEAALLTGAPRNASVKTLEPSTVVILKRRHLLKLLDFDYSISSQIVELLMLRSRPERLPNIEIEQYQEEGRSMTILKNTLTQSYYRLSPEGWFIWQLLDGKHHLRDLALEYLSQFKSFAPHQIADVIAGLAANGFLKKKYLKQDVEKIISKMTWVQKIISVIHRCLTATIIFKNVDLVLSKIYHCGLGVFFNKGAFVGLTLFSLSGLGIFALQWKHMAYLLGEKTPLHIPIIILGVVMSFVIHEAAHAFATKSYGRKVYGIGFGWHWITPIVFVDTTDMWLLPKWPRMVVSLAGPYSHLVFSALFVWVSFFVGLDSYSLTLWIISFISYGIFLINLNPLLETDLQYALSDYFDKPNLFSLILKNPYLLILSIISTLLILMGFGAVILTFL